MVGASFAAGLVKTTGQALKIGIVDARPPAILKDCVARSQPDARVYALSPKSRRFLFDIGAMSLVEDNRRSMPYHDMQVWESEGPGLVRFSANQMGLPELGVIAEDSTIQASCFAALHANSEATGSTPELILDSTVVGLHSDKSPSDNAFTSASASASDAPVQVTLQNSSGRQRVVGARLVVGADGGNSAVRRLAGIPTWGWGYGQRALVATVRTQAPGHGHATAWQVYLPSGPLALLPLWDGYSSIVWSMSVEQATHVGALGAETFQELLNEALTRPPQTQQWTSAARNGTAEGRSMDSPLSVLRREVGHPLASPHLFRCASCASCASCSSCASS